jgi:hypothetical protein
MEGAAKTEHRTRDYLMTGAGLIFEFAAGKYGISILAWTGSIFLLWAFLNYTRGYLGEKNRRLWLYPSYAAGVLILILVNLTVTGVIPLHKSHASGPTVVQAPPPALPFPEKHEPSANDPSPTPAQDSNQPKPSTATGCDAASVNETFKQIRGVLKLRDDYDKEQMNLAQKKADKEHVATEPQRQSIELDYESESSSLWKAYYQPRYDRDFRRDVENARDLIGAGLPKGFETSTVPYDHPRGPDDLTKIANELKRLADACQVGRPD